MTLFTLLSLSQTSHTESLRQRQETVEMLLLHTHHTIVHELQQQTHVPGRGVPQHDHRVPGVAAAEGLEDLSEPVAAGCQHESVTLQCLVTTLQAHVLQISAVEQVTQAGADALLEVIPLQTECFLAGPHHY